MPKGRVSIVVERCKACGFCVEFCPTKVLVLSSAFNFKGYHPPHVVAGAVYVARWTTFHVRQLARSIVDR